MSLTSIEVDYKPIARNRQNSRPGILQSQNVEASIKQVSSKYKMQGRIAKELNELSTSSGDYQVTLVGDNIAQWRVCC